MTDDKRGSSGVPEGWKNRTFGEIAEFRNGLNFVSTDKGESVKLIGVGDFQKHFRLPSTKTLTSVRMSGEVKSDDLLNDGDLLFVRSNGNKELVGRCLYIQVGSERVSFSGFTIRARTHDDEVLPEYVALGFHSGLLRQQLLDAGGGTNISNLSQKLLSELKFVIPPLKEQRKIAEILSAWDEAIEQQTRLLELKRERKRGLMQQLLTGRIRFKGFAGLEWDEVALEKLASFIGRGTAPTYAENETVAYAINQKCVRNGAVSTKFSRAHDDNSSIKEVSILQHHDICINSTGTGTAGRVGLWEQPKDDNYYFVDTHVTILRLQLERANPKFITDLLQTPQLQNRLEVECIFGGTNQVELSRTDLAKLSLNIPPLKEQQKIATVLWAADAEIETLTAQLAALRSQKRGMMQRLLTGKTRVQVA